MGAFRNNQRPAPNPHINGDIVPGFWGLSAVGGMTCQQANTTLDYYVDPYPATVEGSETILTQVIDWPFSEDDAGIAFDQANLYGVRTRCWRIPIADGGGDRDSWTAVPKTLPAEYTAVGRCGILPAIFADYLGANPLESPPSWNHRTPTGVLLDLATAEGSARSQWAPMNYNQQVVGADLGDAYTGQWVFYGPDESFSVEESLWVAALIASNHIGFRGGKLVFTIGATYAGEVPVSGSFTMEIVAVSVLDTWDPFDSATESVVEVLTSATIAWSFTSFLDPPVVLEITLGDMRPTDVGVPFNFYVRYAFDASYENGNTVAPIYGTSHVFQLSPRTDVPLWYFASTRNKVAPGGIVQPPAP